MNARFMSGRVTNVACRDWVGRWVVSNECVNTVALVVETFSDQQAGE
jgi:hypothetical protein